MELSGHSGEIFAAKFDPTGNLIASGGMDRSLSEQRAMLLQRQRTDFGSALENLWRLRKLRNIKWSPRCHSGLAMVMRLGNSI